MIEWIEDVETAKLASNCPKSQTTQMMDWIEYQERGVVVVYVCAQITDVCAAGKQTYWIKTLYVDS